jgi:zinc transport system substrate-binding protein
MSRIFKSKWIFGLLVIMMIIPTGCRQKKEAPKPTSRVRIVASFMPMYIFTSNVIKGVEGVSLEILLPPGGASPHDYSMTPRDMKKLADADLLVMNGLGIESFMGDSYRNVNAKLKIITASQGIETLPDIPSDRMLVGGGSGDSHGVSNPHVWVSPARAAMEVKNIGEGLAAFDPANADAYRKNAEEYAAQLNKIAELYRQTLAGAKNRKIVTVHNAFDYLAFDMGLQVVAVLRVDSSAEPSAAELVNITNTIKAQAPVAIFTEPQFSDKLAKMLSQETGVPIFSLNPVDTGELNDNYYIQTMIINLDILRKALGTGG